MRFQKGNLGVRELVASRMGNRGSTFRALETFCAFRSRPAYLTEADASYACRLLADKFARILRPRDSPVICKRLPVRLAFEIPHDEPVRQMSLP